MLILFLELVVYINISFKNIYFFLCNLNYFGNIMGFEILFEILNLFFWVVVVMSEN